jgi:hypothetical protein
MKRLLEILLVMSVLLLPLVLGGCGIGEAATKTEKTEVKGKSKDAGLLDNALVTTEGANDVVIKRDEMRVTGSNASYDADGNLIKGRPAKVAIQFGRMSSQSEDEGGVSSLSQTTVFELARFMGRSPGDTIAMLQGTKATGTPFGDFWSGQSKGYGIAERLWDKVVRGFWTIVAVAGIVIVVTILLCIFPATRFIGIAILRVLSYIPGVGTILAPLIDWLDKKKYNAVTLGIENFKAVLAKSTVPTEYQDTIKAMLKEELMRVQSDAQIEELRSK